MTLDDIDDATAAAAFRRLVHHLRHRADAENIDLMGLAGFCRNCLSDWVSEAGGIAGEDAREAIYGMPYAQWKAEHQRAATPEQTTDTQPTPLRLRCNSRADSLTARIAGCPTRLRHATLPSDELAPRRCLRHIAGTRFPLMLNTMLLRDVREDPAHERTA